MNLKPLDPSLLYKPCNIEKFHFSSTEELDDIETMIGQERAVQSIRFGIRMAKRGYNIFALAPSGTGKLTIVEQLARQEASHLKTPHDWCYINNFEQPAKPLVVKLVAGRGRLFAQAMADLVDELNVAIPAAFDGDEYRSKSQELEEFSRKRVMDEINQLRVKAADIHIILSETSTGYVFSPVDKNNEVINAEKFNKLPEQEQQEIHKNIEKLQQELNKLLKKLPNWRKETRRKLQALNREVAESAIIPIIKEIRTSFADHAAILSYLDDVQSDIINHLRDFMPQHEPVLSFLDANESTPYQRYAVNLIVDLSQQIAAPVVYEDHPNYANLLGRVDHRAHMGALVTDFTMIKPGALHKANGGYLILDARKLLTQPYAWESLKRTLQAEEIRIETLEHSLSLISSTSLEPEPIPLDVKLILFGDRIIYYLLSQYDPEFQDLFKVPADFDVNVNRVATEQEYPRLLATIARYEKIRHLSKQAVVRVIEHSSRLAGDSEKLSTHLRSIKDLLLEANYWAEDNGHETISASDVEQAIEQGIYRLDRIREKLYENINRGTIMIDTDGKVLSQINALSVLQLGEFSFGQPSKITAATRLGNGKVVDIERETKLGGAFHSKGVMILSSFIASRYARNSDFSVSASLVFEQSYGQVDGDSASLAELCVILSSLADVPLRQDLAITGSINQLGMVQPIGGVNEKIEGFFDTCKQRGLTGSQGVIIPETNINFLMLRWDVVQAAKEGQFHIYAVSTVDEALELLTEMEAGVLDKGGKFQAETFNGRVENQLEQFALIKKNLTQSDKNEE